MKLLNKTTYAAVAAALCAAATACSDNDCPPIEKEKYVYDIPQTDLGRDAVVGAYYTNITSSSTWLKSGKPIYTGTPDLGQYLSTDDGILAKQVEYADQAALDFFIFGWDNGSSDTKLIDNFKKARAENGGNVRFIINYNTKHLKATNDSPLETEANLAKMTDEFTKKILPMFADDAYYKLPDGTPVIMITPVNLSSSATSSIDYSKVMPAVKATCAEGGCNPYFIGEFTTGWAAPANYKEHQLASFDGLTLNDWKTNVYDRYYAFFSFIDLNWKNWANTIAQYGADFVPCIFPSFSDRVNSSSSYYYEFGQKGNTSDYINFCNVAKRNVGKKDVVIVRSWNDYQKGTNLEPTVENAGLFLYITRQQFKK